MGVREAPILRTRCWIPQEPLLTGGALEAGAGGGGLHWLPWLGLWGVTAPGAKGPLLLQEYLSSQKSLHATLLGMRFPGALGSKVLGRLVRGQGSRGTALLARVPLLGAVHVQPSDCSWEQGEQGGDMARQSGCWWHAQRLREAVDERILPLLQGSWDSLAVKPLSRSLCSGGGGNR